MQAQWKELQELISKVSENLDFEYLGYKLTNGVFEVYLRATKKYTIGWDPKKESYHLTRKGVDVFFGSMFDVVSAMFRRDVDEALLKAKGTQPSLNSEPLVNTQAHIQDDDLTDLKEELPSQAIVPAQNRPEEILKQTQVAIAKLESTKMETSLIQAILSSQQRTEEALRHIQIYLEQIILAQKRDA